MDEIQQQYNSLAARMGDLTFKARDLQGQLNLVNSGMAELEKERQALIKRMSELRATEGPADGKVATETAPV